MSDCDSELAYVIIHLLFAHWDVGVHSYLYLFNVMISIDIHTQNRQSLNWTKRLIDLQLDQELLYFIYRKA